ncbi:ATP-binding protein [Sphingobacterium sp. G1-14]|uniref:ATP-binding protein n=1 Tax=Sphingobacterium sp. G1-14 TaxID=2003121 RepID=UPI000B49357C|nr:AAA family ATPase [Sphingobacterium sp. G1-14]
MEELVQQFKRRIRFVDMNFVRNIMYEINWSARLIGIKGARGIGKTTLLLQYIKLNLFDRLDEVLYVSLDAVWFNNKSLLDLVYEFDQKGGKYLFLDEVHKYEGWAQILKNIYDDYPEMKIIFTGSSLLEILNARADLSRRAVVYKMQGFSFREFLSLETKTTFPIFSLDQILEEHSKVDYKINAIVKPFQHFEKYLKYGYYPYYREQLDLYEMRVMEVINMILEIELPLLRNVDIAYVTKIKQLLVIIAESVPFVPNISKLSEKIGISRTTLLSYLYYLDEISLTHNLYKVGEGISQLQKPSKIFLDNTNLSFLFAHENVNPGNLRETFFVNQLAFQHQVNYAEQGDFIVDEKYTFEVGGRDKSNKQIKRINNAYIAADDIEFGHQNKVPLWLFGFLY